MISELKQSIFDAVKKAYPDVDIKLEDIALEHPAVEKYGDYSTNIALKLKIDAKKIIENLPGATLAGPGFINFKLSSEQLVSHVHQALKEKDRYGQNKTGKGIKVALEHTNVNPNKALHIGHLRNACIGQSIERLWEANGYDVEVQYYVDDTGSQVASTVLALMKYKNKPEAGEKFDHFCWREYAKIEQLMIDNPEIVEEKKKVLQEIEDGNNETAKFSKETAVKIIYDNLLTCHWFGFDYDVLIWEGDILRLGLWKKAFEVLQKSPAFVLEKEGKNAGCWVIKDEATGGQLGGDKVLVRTNGTVIYAGKDIAYHLWKFNLLGIDFNYRAFPNGPQKKPLWSTTSENGVANPGIGKADVVLDVIDLRQSFTIEAVKQSIKALNFEKQAKNLHHIAYGVVYLSEGSMKKMGFETEEGKKVYAMSGRRGIGIMVDLLLEKVKAEVERLFPESIDQSQAIAVAAIKYRMLNYNTFSDVIFDLESALSLQGDSGPYIQYTYARARSVLRKSKTVGAIHESPLQSEELSVLRWIYRFPEVVEAAAKNYSPNLVCSYLFELAKRFNNLYNNCPILENNFRLALTEAVSVVLKNGLTLLGIVTLERM